MFKDIETYTVRLMIDSPRGGIVMRNDGFLVANFNQVKRGLISGCASLVFGGDVPSHAELSYYDLQVSGTWRLHKTYGQQLNVDSWGTVARADAATVAQMNTPTVTKSRRIIIEQPKQKPVNAVAKKKAAAKRKPKAMTRKSASKAVAARRATEQQKTLNLTDTALTHWADTGGDPCPF